MSAIKNFYHDLICDGDELKEQTWKKLSNSSAVSGYELAKTMLDRGFTKAVDHLAKPIGYRITFGSFGTYERIS